MRSPDGLGVVWGSGCAVAAAGNGPGGGLGICVSGLLSHHQALVGPKADEIFVEGLALQWPGGTALLAADSDFRLGRLGPGMGDNEPVPHGVAADIGKCEFFPLG